MPEPAANALWYGTAPLGRFISWVLLPLAWLFALLARLRRVAYQRGWLTVQRCSVPVVVVGNITVGGSGKTPLVAALAQSIVQRGIRVGIVSRGYGGSRQGPALLPDNAAAREFGDEPSLLQALTGLPVAIGVDRPAAAQLLADKAKVQLILADDGLQHYALGRVMEIAVVDARRGFGNGRRLPAGPLRESIARLQEVDAVVVQGECSDSLRATLATPKPIVNMALRVTQVESLGPQREQRTLASFAPGPVHGVAAIGDPHRFFASLRAAGIEVIEHAATDHHAWVAADLPWRDHPVLMTPKDAVKCRSFARAGWWQVQVRAELEATGSERLLQTMTALVQRPLA